MAELATTLKTYAPQAKAIATLLQVGGQFDKGRAADEQARIEAAQLRRQATNQRGISQREASEARRRGELATSRARAVAGASGAGADDPTVTNVIGDIEGRGEYNALTALYNGDFTARGMDATARAARRTGRAARGASRMQAGATILSNAESLLDVFK